MKLVRLVISLVAIIAAIVFGLRIPTDWYGEVYTDGTTAVEQASVILVKRSLIVTTVFTTSEGKFSINAGPRDTTERLVICKRGFEAATVNQRPPRRRRNADRVQGSVVQLVKDNPDFEPPIVATLRGVLPSECR